MSNTKVDMGAVKKMLDGGWEIMVNKNDMGSYTAIGWNHNGSLRVKLFNLLATNYPERAQDNDWDIDERLYTDDFTPEQALTRLAYKTQGVIL